MRDEVLTMNGLIALTQTRQKLAAMVAAALLLAGFATWGSLAQQDSGEGIPLAATKPRHG